MTDRIAVDRAAIVRRILVAAAIGVVAACFVLLPALTLIESCSATTGCGGPSLIDTLAGLAGIGIAALMFGAVIYMPVLVVVLLLGAVFWRRIAARPALWAFGTATLAFLAMLPVLFPGTVPGGAEGEAGPPLDLSFMAFLAVALLLPAAIFVRLSRASRGANE